MTTSGTRFLRWLARRTMHSGCTMNRHSLVSYTENRIRPPDERVRLPNLLTPKDLFGENQEIRKHLRPNGLLARLAT